MLSSALVVILMVVPTAHPYLMGWTDFPSRALWALHVIPVAVVAYRSGYLGGLVSLIWSAFLIVVTEQFYGPGYWEAIAWSRILPLGGTVFLMNVIVAGLAIYARRDARQLRESAMHDHLTGLPNRQLFLERLEDRIERSEKEGDASFAVLFMDLDEFKLVNDSLGHSVGNQVLKRLARRLEVTIRPEDTLARWGGDEFVILLDHIEDDDTAKRVAHRILEALQTPLEVQDLRLVLNTSIGIAWGGVPFTEAEAVVGYADTAMYRAKQRGKNNVEVYDPSMQDSARARLTLETDLREALKRGEFLFHLQPMYDVEDDAVAGFEALARWRHPEHGIIRPGRFIALAEETGFIVPLGDYMLNEACKILSRWKRKYPDMDGLGVAVNLSPQQLARSGFVDRVQELLRENGVEVENMKLEITESALMQKDEQTRRSLIDLRDLGFEFALDDFGTGYSSLSYLHQFPVEFLKIDRSFIQTLEAGGRNLQILRAVVALAQQLGCETVAEGVETSTQYRRVKFLGCDYAQGNHLARPLPLADVESLLSASALAGGGEEADAEASQEGAEAEETAERDGAAGAAGTGPGEDGQDAEAV